LKHISKRNCALLPYLDDESLHTLGEFIYNIIHQRVKLDALQEKKVKGILKKDKDFYKKLIDQNTKDPLGYFRKSLKFDPQVGTGIVSLIAALAPLISSLILK
jgi:CRISPR/Cas system-associated protein Cas10 (large subunit of type III CRISPR-Cas system)